MALTKGSTLLPIPNNCQHYGCPNPAVRGHYCEAHKRGNKSRLRTEAAQADPSIATAAKFYNSSQWKRLRRMVLSAEPLCRMCGRGACEVDHITPIRQGGSRSELTNLQALCSSCHASKTRLEERDRRKGR